MNRLLSLTLLLLLSVAVCAQERYVTHFLGIPVDGSKTEMRRKLREKGFRASRIGDLKGEFNGRDVYLSIVTNRDRVWRIAVVDATPSSKTQIVIRFNKLCRQFQDNPKYMSLSDDPTIPDNEDVSHEIIVRDKRYEAVFCQADPTMPASAQLSDRLAAFRSVWFFISKDGNSSSDFRIRMYYDNEFNSGYDGSDL